MLFPDPAKYVKLYTCAINSYVTENLTRSHSNLSLDLDTVENDEFFRAPTYQLHFLHLCLLPLGISEQLEIP